MSAPLARMHPGLSLLLTTVMLFVLALASVGATCGGPQRVAHVSIVASGSAVASVGVAHRAVYEREAERIRAGVAHEGGTIGDYEQRIAPARAAFAARGTALRALESALFGAAAINDAAANNANSAGAAAYGPAARDLLDALRGALRVLEDGSVMPAVTIPAEVTMVVDTLATLAAAATPLPSQSDGGPAGQPLAASLSDASAATR